MSLSFLRDHGGRRIHHYDEQPLLLTDGVEATDVSNDTVELGYEAMPDNWAPRDVPPAPGPACWALCPVRFVDGKDVGRTVAWLQDPEGHPVPVRLSEIGAVVMRTVDGCLRREWYTVERVVTMMARHFPWDEVERFALALQEHDFRLLLSQDPEKGPSFDLERMRKTTQNRSNDEMIRLERQALAQASSVPTVVDGRLEPRVGAFNPETDPIVGLVKTHYQNYLHPQGWRTLYTLRPGQRTPAFVVKATNLDVVTWYLRLAGDGGEMPNWGVVRLEAPLLYFEKMLSKDWGYIDTLSRTIGSYRCRDGSYGRAAVSILPIQRAEERLGALFRPGDSLCNHFYTLTEL